MNFNFKKLNDFSAMRVFYTVTISFVAIIIPLFCVFLSFSEPSWEKAKRETPKTYFSKEIKPTLTRAIEEEKYYTMQKYPYVRDITVKDYVLCCYYEPYYGYFLVDFVLKGNSDDDPRVIYRDVRVKCDNIKEVENREKISYRLYLENTVIDLKNNYDSGYYDEIDEHVQNEEIEI